MQIVVVWKTFLRPTPVVPTNIMCGVDTQMQSVCSLFWALRMKLGQKIFEYFPMSFRVKNCPMSP